MLMYQGEAAITTPHSLEPYLMKSLTMLLRKEGSRPSDPRRHRGMQVLFIQEKRKKFGRNGFVNPLLA
jgi:hypothetical protein